MPTFYIGDVPATFSLDPNTAVRRSGANDKFETVAANMKTFSLIIASPVVGGVCIMRAFQAMTFVRVAGVTFGSSSPTVTFNIEKRTDPSSAGTNIFTLDYTINSTGGSTTTFNSPSVSADDWLYVDVSAKSGTVTFAEITIQLSVA